MYGWMNGMEWKDGKGKVTDDYFSPFDRQLSEYVPSDTWILVYSTYRHGMSLKTLYNRFNDLETPVLIVVKDDNGFVCGDTFPFYR